MATDYPDVAWTAHSTTILHPNSLTKYPFNSNPGIHDSCNVTAITDATGDVLERYGYSAFGDVRFMTTAYVTKPASDHAWDLLSRTPARALLPGARARDCSGALR